MPEHIVYKREKEKRVIPFLYWTILQSKVDSQVVSTFFSFTVVFKKERNQIIIIIIIIIIIYLLLNLLSKNICAFLRENTFYEHQKWKKKKLTRPRLPPSKSAMDAKKILLLLCQKPCFSYLSYPKFSKLLFW